jgi:hypothetical protein
VAWQTCLNKTFRVWLNLPASVDTEHASLLTEFVNLAKKIVVRLASRGFIGATIQSASDSATIERAVLVGDSVSFRVLPTQTDAIFRIEL